MLVWLTAMAFKQGEAGLKEPAYKEILVRLLDNARVTLALCEMANVSSV